MTSLSQLFTRLSIAALLCSLVLPAHAQTWVYRVDRRPPSEAFPNGFYSSGTRLNLLDQVYGYSCGLRGELERSAWASTSYNIELARNFAAMVLRNNPQLQNIWLYSIHTDASYFSVDNIFEQARQAATLGQAGYGAVDGRYMDYLMQNMPYPQTEVVTQRIAPENIHSAILITRSADGQHIVEAPTSIPNAGFIEPATEMNNHVDNLQAWVPSSALENYAHYQGAWSCSMECDEASSSRTERKRRSVENDDPSCPYQPSKAQRLMGIDD